jgi:hypothetical protein
MTIECVAVVTEWDVVGLLPSTVIAVSVERRRYPRSEEGI